MRKLLGGILFVFLQCAMTRECRGQPQRTTSTRPTLVLTPTAVRPSPSPAPSATPRHKLAEISPAAMAEAADSTTARWEAYQREALGKYVRWQGTVMDVQSDGTMFVLTDTDRVTYQVIAQLQVPAKDVTLYEKDQAITFEGWISLIDQRTFFVFVEAIAVLFTNTIILE